MVIVVMRMGRIWRVEPHLVATQLSMCLHQGVGDRRQVMGVGKAMR